MRKHTLLRYIARITLVIILAGLFTIAVSCKSKQKTTERYKNTTEYEYDNSLKQTVQNNLVKDSVATRKTEIDWSSITKSTHAKPIDPNKKASVTYGKDINGNPQIILEQKKLTRVKKRPTLTRQAADKH